MPISQDLSLCRTLPLTTFEQLGQMLQQMAQVVGNEAAVLTEAMLSSIPMPIEQVEKFTLVVSQRFSALLVGTSIDCPSSLNVRLTFDPEAIALFLSQLSDLLQHYPQAQAALGNYRQILQPNDAKLQSEFTLLLLSTLTPKANSNQNLPAAIYPHVSVCQPVEDALRQQIAHERLLNQVTTKIRQSLELPVILTTVVEQVREFLQVDRLVIYQFEERDGRKQGEQGRQGRQGEKSHSLLMGCVVYEARATESIPSVLNYKEENCFSPTSPSWEKYRQGFTLAVADVEVTYTLSKCLLGFLKVSQVRAKLVAPIVIQEKLWGLLIAHQCTEPRDWLDSEKNLLRQIAEQLAIAIHQAELMGALTQEKQTLEQRVIERTQALHDALIAAEAASRAKSEFLATMSHELRSPLTRVIGMSATLLRLGQLNQRQRHYLQTIYDSGEHLLTLINDILDLSQLEAGKAVLNVSTFSLVTLAQASLRSLAETAQRQTVNLKLDLKFEPLCDRFAADRQRVQQILWNLLSNAVKFTPAGGQVILRIWMENNHAVFQVEDTGIGIPEQQLPLLFEKFQQLNSPYCRLYEGAGMGLALTKHLVELHRGRIEVESTVGVGSSFTVWLPMNRE
ncbi:GAF domain-containing sensor histidine kinase [Chroococcidiopsis sp. CCMEE 29]|uniref:sensor histidine kinase n=1 Tax=Chroococcidiopsis sp. CCMEE 29 TaxID=155894 RepID=UPI0020218EFF|nr:GAF domain-containing sensor histidine kinase [Chroococcidiopsis sp. CCMEE 29]